MNDAFGNDKAMNSGDPHDHESQWAPENRAPVDIPAAGITPEIMAVINAAVTAYFGKKVRILSVKAGFDSVEQSDAWARQGREIIQESHNWIQQGH